MHGTGPTGVFNHSMKPGTLSVTSPPPAEVGGPQQGGLSFALPGPEELHALSWVGIIFLKLLILNWPGAPGFTCDIQHSSTARRFL